MCNKQGQHRRINSRKTTHKDKGCSCTNLEYEIHPVWPHALLEPLKVVGILAQPALFRDGEDASNAETSLLIVRP